MHQQTWAFLPRPGGLNLLRSNHIIVEIPCGVHVLVPWSSANFLSNFIHQMAGNNLGCPLISHEPTSPPWANSATLGKHSSRAPCSLFTPIHWPWRGKQF